MSTTLNHAIDHTALWRLQALLKDICEWCPEARNIAKARLLAPPPTGATKDATSVGTKRQQRHSMCKNCKEEFDATENDEEACQYHPESLDVDWEGDFWADHDEDCHGPIDDDGNRDGFPEGFIWSCCKDDGTAEGCKMAEHKVDEAYKPSMERHRMGNKWES